MVYYNYMQLKSLVQKFNLVYMCKRLNNIEYIYISGKITKNLACISLDVTLCILHVTYNMSYRKLSSYIL